MVALPKGRPRTSPARELVAVSVARTQLSRYRSGCRSAVGAAARPGVRPRPGVRTRRFEGVSARAGAPSTYRSYTGVSTPVLCRSAVQPTASRSPRTADLRDSPESAVGYVRAFVRDKCFAY